MTTIQIEPAATEENAAVVLNAADNVAIARVPLAPGQHIAVRGSRVEIREAIAAGHKVAIVSLAKGTEVRRYGQVIGIATGPIAAGAHVHTQNMELARTDVVMLPHDLLPARANIGTRTFEGYRRTDGRAGTRNYVAVVSASNCAAHTANLIEQSFAGRPLPPGVDGVVSFPHGDGCGQALGPDTDQLRRTLEGVLHHPNVAAAIILGLGCEVNQIDHYLGPATAERPKSLVGMTLQGSGGTRGAVDKAGAEIESMLEEAAACRRTSIPASELTLGLNCGGSDSFSGITANPALGACCDLLVAEGGTVILAETTEIFGAEHLLTSRARSREVAERLLGCVANYKRYLDAFGESFDDNPSPGNKTGGLTNIVEKSLGAVAKAGSTPLEDVVEYAERIRSHGLIFMNTPGYDPASLAGLAAGGVNLIAFTTGRGSAIGFATIPVLKISSNTPTYRRMPDNIDVNAGPIAEGRSTVEAVGHEIFEALLRTASGERTKAEVLGHHEFVPWRIGPVL